MPLAFAGTMRKYDPFYSCNVTVRWTDDVNTFSTTGLGGCSFGAAF
jgi:hypothetical protein